MKTLIILKMYDALMRGASIVREEFCKMENITQRTFYRYMNEITAFLRLSANDCVIDVVEPLGRYYLKKYDKTPND